MIWADKLAIAWAGFITLCVAFLWLTAGDPIGLVGALTNPEFFGLLAKLVLPPWMFLRLLAWLFSSHGTRRA